MYKSPVPLKLYTLEGGSHYGVIHTTYIDWCICREVFRGYFFHENFNQDHSGFLFSVPKSGRARQIANIKRMARLLQKKMGLAENERFTVDDTERSDAVYIALPEFWRTKVRLEFLTAFLRACKDPRRKTVAQVIQQGKYLKNSQPAARRFMSGYTQLADGCKCYGWNELFSKKTTKEVQTILV